MASIITAHEWGSSSEQYFVSIGTNCKHVNLYSSGMKEVKELNLRSFMLDVNCVDYCRRRFGLVAANNKQYPSVFDITKPEMDAIELKTSHSRVSSCLAFSPEGAVLAVGLEKLKNHHGVHVYEDPEQTRNYRSYLSNDSIHSLKFVTAKSLLAGVSGGIKEVDLRALAKLTVYSLSTIYTNYLDVGPFDDYFFSCVSNDKSGNIAIYDRRYLSKFKTAPVIELENMFNDDSYIKKNIEPCYRFCPWANELTTLHQPTKADSLLKRWNFGYEVLEVDSGLRDNIDSLFVSKVKDIHDGSRLVSFDYCRSEGYGSMVALKLSGKVAKMAIIDGDKAVQFNNYNSIVIGLGNDLLIETSDRDENKDENVESDLKPAHQVLQNDIASVMYKRAVKDYNLTNLYQNSELFSQFNKSYIRDDSYLNSNYEQLRICWKWLYYSNENCVKQLTVQNGLNISFEGIYNIWDGLLEIVKDEQKRLNAALFKTKSKTSKSPQDLFLATLKNILDLVHKPGNRYMSTVHCETSKSVERKYCLFSCGWYITKHEFDAKIAKLISLRYYEKAAGLCVFQGDVLRAVEILSTVPDESVQKGYLDLRIIAAAMMGFHNLNNEKIDDMEYEPLWKEQCRKLSRNLPSPYLRAIFAYLTDGNWQDVLEEPSLALKEKLLIALKFLPDDKLTQYLKSVTKEVIRSGNPEGIMLTGLTRKGVSLLQAYNDRYSDVQTVALISAFAVPRFFDDVRANNWISSYCDLLNSWKLFKIRAKFDIARRKLSRNYLYNPNNDPDHHSRSSELDCNSQYFLKKKDRQLYLKCIQCDRDISHLLHSKKQSFHKKQVPKKHQPKKDKNTVTCVCGASLPKCAICLYSLGAPIRYSESKENNQDYFRDWGSFCLNCNHGMHAKHADEWFENHAVCPVPDCHCHCIVAVD